MTKRILRSKKIANNLTSQSIREDSTFQEPEIQSDSADEIVDEDSISINKQLIPMSTLLPDFTEALKNHWIENKFEWKPRKVQGDLVLEWIEEFSK